MNTTQQLKAEIEAAAQALGIAPSTVGERAGQGGRFYRRLCDGKRVWPETAQAVRERLHSMLSPSADADGSLACPDHLVAKENNFKGATHETR